MKDTRGYQILLKRKKKTLFIAFSFSLLCMKIFLSISIPYRAYIATVHIENEDIIITINIDHFFSTLHSHTKNLSKKYFAI